MPKRCCLTIIPLLICLLLPACQGNNSPQHSEGLFYSSAGKPALFEGIFTAAKPSYLDYGTDPSRRKTFHLDAAQPNI